MKALGALDGYRQRDRRVLEMYGSFGDEGNGVFNLPCPRTGVFLHCVASNGGGWDHVSVSLPNRCPNWIEMEHRDRRGPTNSAGGRGISRPSLGRHRCRQ
jgi:hypothetical protein